MSRPPNEPVRRRVGGRRPTSATAFVVAAAAIGIGCVQEMSDQPRVDPLEPSAFFADGLSARPRVAGTVARGEPVDDGPLSTGREEGRPVKTIPVELTEKLLDRGRERFGIYCAPCHGPSGSADGTVVQRGFPRPPTYHSDRLRAAPDGHFFLVISDGFGRMPSFRTRIAPQDRWAIAGYVRALQLSQNASWDELPEQDRKELETGTKNAAP